VRVEGLEPPSLAAPDPKSGVSTNFTTPAKLTEFQTAALFKVGGKGSSFSSKKGNHFLFQ